jgi:quinol-cytochrome oxidoreductase complex cytochrome b subunit
MSLGTASDRIRGWCAERLRWDGPLGFLKKKTVPRHPASGWYCLGSLLLTLLLVQAVTGVVLLFFYQPTPETAYESVRSIVLEAPFGWLIRSLHSWSASLLVAVAFVHLFSTLFLRSYRRPRELTWVSGLFLFSVILGLGFSGYLLPWNELSYFATKVGTGIAGQVPVIGEGLKRFLRGGADVGAATLTRFFALHVVVLPAALFGGLAVHLYLVQVHGMSVPISLEDRKDRLPQSGFFPDFVLREASYACIAVAVLATLAVLFPWELGQKVNPLQAAPEGIKPEWYFLFAYKFLQLIPARIGPVDGETLGVLFLAGGFVLLLAVPFVDRASSRGRRSHLFTAIGVGMVLFLVLLTVWALL